MVKEKVSLLCSDSRQYRTESIAVYVCDLLPYDEICHCPAADVYGKRLLFRVYNIWKWVCRGFGFRGVRDLHTLIFIPHIWTAPVFLDVNTLGILEWWVFSALHFLGML